MKMRFEVGDIVVWAVQDHNFRLTMTSRPMRVLRVHYFEGREWFPNIPIDRPIIPEQSGMMYDVGYWTDNTYNSQISVNGRLVKGPPKWRVTTIHEKWLTTWDDEFQKILTEVRIEQERASKSVFLAAYSEDPREENDHIIKTAIARQKKLHEPYGDYYPEPLTKEQMEADNGMLWIE